MQPTPFFQAAFNFQSEYFQLVSTQLQFTSFCLKQWANAPTNLSLPMELTQHAFHLQNTQNERYWRAVQNFMTRVNTSGENAYSISPVQTQQSPATAQSQPQPANTSSPCYTKPANAAPAAPAASTQYFKWDNAIWSAYPEKYAPKAPLSSTTEQKDQRLVAATTDTATPLSTKKPKTAQARSRSRSSSAVASASSARRTRTSSTRTVTRAVSR